MFNKLMKAVLIINLEILLLVPTCVQQKVDRGYKSADQYWSETGLDSKDLEALISNESCYSSQKSFLSCVNSISVMAERFGMVLNLDGTFRKIQTSDIKVRATEKKQLEPWTKLFDQPEVSSQVSFVSLWQELNQKYVQGPERSAVIAAGINGFLSIFKDPHTYIMPLAMYEEVVATSDTRQVSAGFIAKKDTEHLVVKKVFDGSPAELSGLKRGDRIVEINGTPVPSLLPSQISDLVRMRSAERLGLKVLRPLDKNQSKFTAKYFEVIKSEKTYPSVVSKLIEGNSRAGLLTIHKFSKDSCRQAKTQLVSLKEQNIQGLMLDLRDNPGGQVEEAACILNLFVAEGTFLFETRYLDLSKNSDRYFADEEPIYKGSLAVLINSGSASASEIVAGVLKDMNRAKLVGERSFGKGSFQDGRIWASNQKVALFQTEGLYYFPTGWTPQLVGLEPDISVDFNNLQNQREDELYFSPITPLDNWNGPQALTWLTERSCDMDSASLMETAVSSSDDPQLLKAQAWLSCGKGNGNSNGRNGSL